MTDEATLRSRWLGEENGQHVYRIVGGTPVSGEIRPRGNKNAALPMLAAALLTGEPVRIANVPDIRDVRVMLGLLDGLGAEVRPAGAGAWEIRAAALGEPSPAVSLAREIRASFLLAGPLLGRLGRAVLPRPGGDRIGIRPLDAHVHAFRELGADVEVLPDRYVMTAPRGLHGADLFLPEASVMATENALMAAALAEGTTVIRNAACEPHVQELAAMLAAMGVRIAGAGSGTVTVEGRKELGGAEVEVGPDYVEVGSLIGLAAATGGELLIRDARPREHHRMTRIAFGRLGITWEERSGDIFVPAGQTLRVQEALHGALPKIDDGPWPAFPADLTSIAVVLATQAEGTVLVHEKMFESRLFWVDGLIRMGARIILCDPHRVVVTGPARLHGATLSSPDIRAGMALVIAALAAEGESVIHNVQQIERGYERLHERLRALGARIERL